MTYRKITVDSVNYEFAAGKTHTKIKVASTGKALGVFENKIYANMMGMITVVTPATVRRMIEGKEGPRVLHCEKHAHYTTHLVADPYAAEIEGRTRLMMDCPECVNDLAMDI